MSWSFGSTEILEVTIQIGLEQQSAKQIDGRALGKNRKMTVKSALCLLTVLVILSIAAGIDDKCGACNAVAEEIELGLSSEKPRNHLDMRHRLDSKGQREGKLIDYRVSELRVVELLDGLCEKMQDYTLREIDSTKQEWVKVHDWDNITDKQEARAYSKVISTYCGRLLEETEDELADLIKKGSVEVGGVSKVLCEELSNHCSPKSGSHQPGSNSHGDVDGEL